MNKNFFKALVAVAMASASALVADRGTETNLAHIKFRDYYDSPYVYTGGAHAMAMENAQREDSFGGCLSVMGFWEQSLNGSRGSQELAKGFGVNKLNSFKFGQTSAVGSPNITTPAQLSNANIVEHNFIVRDTVVAGNNAAATDPQATLSLEAKHRRYGVNVQYCQDLSQFYDGLKFSVSTAALGVRNELIHTFSDVTNSTNNTAVKLKDYLEGNAENKALTAAAPLNDHNQAALTRGIMKGDHQTEYHFNDVQACLGLNIVDTENAKVCVGVEGVIPVGRELTGKYLMEPQVGNRHFKLGGKVSAMACLAEGSDYKASLGVCGLWHYAFKRENYRLPSHNKYNYGHYFQSFNANSIQTYTEPLINLVPVKVDVKPGNMFNAAACLTIEKGCMCIDLGYNFHYSQDEKNDVKNFTSDSTWHIAHTTLDSDSLAVGSDATPVKKADLEYNAKSQAHHQIFGSLGFMCKDMEYPASINVIGSYEFAHNRTRTREVWGIGVKGGICF